MTEIAIRPVTATDQPAWRPLWRAYQVFYGVDLSDEVSDVLWTRMLDPAEPIHGALAWTDAGEAVGLAHWLTHRSTWSVEDLCYLNDLFVAPGVRGGGVGRKLIQHVYDAAAAAGAPRIYWLTHETNTTAQALYNNVATRTGFIHYGQTLR